ncbi:receptor-type tyrosine-protein phosphatase H isoform X2 [Entelurus aequoreus]|uniref:receptor-type tyrosine-protein phosphatase H isoform X2 n=1 Tax=Entelurus aequoreus TaxID=161455 RepID=UPI002B1D8132|nr:receptor-type tyrosine-protein phosphatase H isoform X2 [Entelurus aequoreus]
MTAITITFAHLLLCVYPSLLWGTTAQESTKHSTASSAEITTGITTVISPTLTSHLTKNQPPENVQEVTVQEQNETSITLQWEKLNNISTYFLQYGLRGGVKEERVNAMSGQLLVKHVVTHLTAGRKYQFRLISEFMGANSSGYIFSAPTAPEDVKYVDVVTQTESSITLSWDKVGNISTYTLQCVDCNITKEDMTFGWKAVVMREVSSLAAGKRYNFTLITVFENVNSTGFTFAASTLPSMVAVVNVTERSDTSLTLAWEKMDAQWTYLLHIYGTNVTVKSSNVSHSFTSLQPGTEYPFTVITMFSGLNSTTYTGFSVTAINCTNEPWHVTTSSIQGAIEGLFTSATASNGSHSHVSATGSQTVSFSGLYPGATYNVSLQYERNSTHFVQCRHQLTTIPPDLTAHCNYWDSGYSVFIVWDKPDGLWSAVEVNVSGKTCIVDDIGQQHVKIPGFQPARTYGVSLSSLSGRMMRSKAYVFHCSTDPRGVIAASVVSILLIGVLACVTVFILMKRPNGIIRRKMSFLDGVTVSTHKVIDIPLEKFPAHFYSLSMDQNQGFIEEYKCLALVGTDQMQNAALMPVNSEKNRFTNVLPYDWCRVKLQTTNGMSDYINASYIPGYSSCREYIATQGPLPSTVSDFWRMIWEQRVSAIVMLTNCVEGTRTKCEHYWPAQSKSCFYGDLTITITSEQQKPNWTIREFHVKHRNIPAERMIKHFHFTAWPDHGVPQGTDVLIQFRGLIGEHIEAQGNKAPIVVHCSAGVGRTGTIIALDVLLQQLHRDRKVNINALVHKMRLHRPYMVQTEVTQTHRNTHTHALALLSQELHRAGIQLTRRHVRSTFQLGLLLSLQSQYVFLNQCILNHLKS